MNLWITCLQQKREVSRKSVDKRKTFESLEKRLTAVEDEQSVLKNYIEEKMKSDEELINIVKRLRDEIYSFYSKDTNITESQTK